MPKDKFDVNHWLTRQQKPEPIPPSGGWPERSGGITYSDQQSEVLQLIEKLESSSIDLTASYEEWRNIGFALADAFGENGREIYHRISRFHPEYDYPECDKQFDACLKSNGSGVNLNTLFYLAKNAGITIGKQSDGPARPKIIEPRPQPKAQQEDQDQSEQLPTLPDSLFPQLPQFLTRIVTVAENKEERDLLLLGSLVTLSSTLPTIYGIYHNRKVFANLFLFVSAKASAGKGRLNHCRKLVKPIHDDLKRLNDELYAQYEQDLAQYNILKRKNPNAEKPEKPPLRLLFLPANNSAAGTFQLLKDNDGKGLLFETEGDTLANTFRSDFGNYSDGFRKAFHHEMISYYRKTDREHVELENPCLSAVLSGTPKQVVNLIPSAEDGLFSRFMFYFMNLQPEWADVFSSNSPVCLDDLFYQFGREYFPFYQELKKSRPIEFQLSREQQLAFNSFFSQRFHKYTKLKGEDYIGTIRRLGLIAFRLSMILSVMRLMETGEVPETILCEQQDFESALSIADTLMVHAAYIFAQLPENDQPTKRMSKKERFYASLPAKFNRQSYLEVAEQHGVNPKTAERYISEFQKAGMIHREAHNEYVKDSEEVEEIPD